MDQDLVAHDDALGGETRSNIGHLRVEVRIGPALLFAALGFPDQKGVFGLVLRPVAKQPWDVLAGELEGVYVV